MLLISDGLFCLTLLCLDIFINGFYCSVLTKPEEFKIAAFSSTVRPTVHTNPSRKRSHLKTPAFRSRVDRRHLKTELFAPNSLRHSVDWPKPFTKLYGNRRKNNHFHYHKLSTDIKEFNKQRQL